jgi:hypothetical protein
LTINLKWSKKMSKKKLTLKEAKKAGKLEEFIREQYNE